MKTKLLTISIALSLFIGCGEKKQDAYSFESFVASFPEKDGDVHLFNLGVRYMPKDSVVLDTLQLSLYLPLEMLNDLPLAPTYQKPIYAVSRLNIQKGITSLVYAQLEGDFNSENMFLANYDENGKLLSAQALAYDFGGASTYYQLEGRMDKGVFKFKETEGQRRPEEGQEPLVKEFSLEMTEAGLLRPSMVSTEILGTSYEVQLEGGEWMRFMPCDSMTNEFQISTEGPMGYFTGLLNGEPFSFVIRAIKQSGSSFYLSVDPSESLESPAIEIEVIAQKDKDGLFQINNRYNDLFDELYFTNTKNKDKFSVFNEEGCNPPLELITENGVAGIRFEMPLEKLNDVVGLRKITQEEFDDMAGAKVTYYNMIDPNSDSVYIRVDANGEVKYVDRIHVYSTKYKTERGIGVGSTLADIANNYEGLNILSGDIGLIVYTNSFENIGFILDDSNYSAPDQEVLIKDVPQGLKVKSVYMFKIYQYD